MNDSSVTLINNSKQSNLIIAISLFVAVSFFYFSITSNDYVVGFLSDDAVYLLMAEMHSLWNRDFDPVIEYMRPEYQFPPLYPFLLGLMGADSSSPELASSITTLFLLSSISIFGLWVWHETKNIIPALLLPLIFSFLSDTIIMSQGLNSEFLFMCFIYSAFICLSTENPSDDQWMLAALFLSLASLTRIIGISFIAAYCLLLILRKPNRSFILGLISTGPIVYWTLFRNSITGRSNYIEQFIITFKQNDDIISVFIEHLSGQTSILIDSIYWIFSCVDGVSNSLSIHLVLIFILVLISFSGFIVRLKQKRIDAIAVPLYLGIIYVWPFTGTLFVSRFLFPLMPIFLFYLWAGKEIFAKINIKYHLMFILSVILITYIAYPSTNKLINRAFLNIDPELMPYRRSRDWLLAETDEMALQTAIKTKELISVFKSLQKSVDRQDCIYAFQTPVVMVYSKRTTAKLPPPTVSDDEFNEKTRYCRYILATDLVDANGDYQAFYPLYRLPDNDDYQTTPYIIKTDGKEQPIAFLVEQMSFKDYRGNKK